ncbi:hypothetical protein MNBD_GAMMA13-2096, partial [hydrothermal vent metagenome]
MCQKFGYMRFAEILRVSFFMEQDVASNPP